MPELSSEKLSSLINAVIEQMLNENGMNYDETMRDLGAIGDATVYTLFQKLSGNTTDTDEKAIEIIRKEVSDILELARLTLEFKKETRPFLEDEIRKLNEQYPDANINVDYALQLLPHCNRITEKEIEETAANLDIPYIADVLRAVRRAADRCREAHKEIEKSIGAKLPDVVCYPLDKFATTLFNNMKAGTEAIKAEPNGSRQEVTNYITLIVDELPEENSVRAVWSGLSVFEKRIYAAVDALLHAGNEYMSASQIWREMGHKKRPSQDQIQRVIASCEKMSRCRVTIDNSEEVEARYHYDRISIKRVYIFPMEITANIAINGKIVKDCIHMLRPTLPIMEIARSRGQIEIYTHEQLAIPLSMTDDTLQLDDYLRRRIARKNATPKIMRQTVYDNCGISKSDRMKKSRLDKKMRTLFEFYKKTGVIHDYKEQTDYFTFERAKN